MKQFRVARVRATILVGLFCFLDVFVGAEPNEEYGKIEILRDRWGTPNVFSDTDAGAIYGLGYACAEDRLFQMCTYRLLMQGRLAEVFGDLEGRRGKTALQEDKQMRVLGFYRAARKVVGNLDDGTRRLLQAYGEGVNDCIAGKRDTLHYLFERYEFRPEPWTPADCIVSWWHLAMFFSSDGLRDRLPGIEPPAARIPPALRRRGPVIDDDAAVVRREDVTEEWIRKTEEFARKHGLTVETPPTETPRGPKFSHAWVIGGKKTTTGSAVLVSDPQTPVWNPSMLYEFHVSGETFNARGVGVPGSPLILIGFNESVAWGMTALGADQADLFLLETDAEHPDQYRLDDNWRDMDVRQETIQVKDGEPVTITVRETCFGPVVSEFIRNRRRGQEVAVKRVPLADLGHDTVQGALAMLRTKTVEEFGRALAGWYLPSANCIFGDKDGSIGYRTIGSIPVRASGSNPGNAAHDGSTTKADWQCMVPHELVPHTTNPKRGYLVSANHRSIQSFYPLGLGTSTGSAGETLRGLRIKQRIREHLATHDKFRPRDVLAIQSDAVNPCKREIVRCGYHIRDVLQEDLNPPALRALDYLKAWYEQGARSDLTVRGAEVANEMQFIFRAGVFPLAITYGGGDSGAALFAKTVKARLDEDPRAALQSEERDFVNTVLTTAWSNAVRRYGPDPSEWHSKAIAAAQTQKLGYYVSLDGYPSLDPDQDVAQPFLRVVDGSTILSQRGQSYTQYVPLHDPDSALSILPFGASERPGSPFRFSTWAEWSSGVLHPAPLSREGVREHAVEFRRLSALPSSSDAARDQQGDEEVLPGQRPSDPELESMARFLIGRASTPEEVDAKLEEVRGCVRGSDDLTAQAISVFRLVIYLEYGTDYARSKMGEAILAMGGELPPKRPEKYKRAQEERQRRRREAAEHGGRRRP